MILKRLRALGHPTRLFGESNEERLKRLGTVELLEERSHGQKNEFKLMLEATEEELAVMRHYGITAAQLGRSHLQASAGDSTTLAQPLEKPKKIRDIDREDLDPSEISTDLLKSDSARLHLLISVYFKRLQREWERTLATRPDEDRLSADVCFSFFRRSS